MANKTVVIVSVAVLLMIGILVLNSPNGSNSKQTSGAPPNASSYVFQPAVVASASGKYTLIDAHFLPGTVAGAYPGAAIRYTALSDMVNTTVYQEGGNVSAVPVPINIPIQVYSVVYVCNDTQSPRTIFQTYANRLSTANGYKNITLAQLGDQSNAFYLSSQNSTLYVIQFTYHNIYAKVGVYYKPGSNNTAMLINVAQALLQTIKNGALTR